MISMWFSHYLGWFSATRIRIRFTYTDPERQNNTDPEPTELPEERPDVAEPLSEGGPQVPTHLPLHHHVYIRKTY